MAIIKCKMCGGDLTLTEGSLVAECVYCGTRQTVPSADSEKKLNLFARANRLRANNEFDKAAGVYESIVADFPEEAEAYWGLILCKYGIEYVDDPATGKKIPTCHRSSFDSVMDDPNFELVMENADPIARRVYRDEAKQLEELRKGIIEVSSKEAPYDIFICYKETADDGQRTLDSVLAQDVYDMLTENGYRVFFSRVTLEDKLGVEYEPYIFAALNSAKIMLAFGTDYEYYNAVWVKNEWSRFLQLIAKGEKKTLIPCYKNLDAYDMPKEFAKLQAQDLGKVGAMQDLLRGIKKILPRESQADTTSAPVRQAAAAGPSVDSLLRRGQLFLEQKEWKSANEYFDKVLDIAPENAEAYVGKYCAEWEQPNLEAAQVMMKNSVPVRYRTTDTTPGFRNTEVDRSREQALIRELTVPGYLTEEMLTELFRFDLRCPDTVKGPEKQLQAMEKALSDSRFLGYAKRFASGVTAQQLQNFESGVLTHYRNKLTEGKQKLADAEAAKAAQYAAHMAEKEPEARQRHDQALAARNRDYEKGVAQMEAGNYISAAETLHTVGNYADAQDRLSFCVAENQRRYRERQAAEAKARNAAERERQRGELGNELTNAKTEVKRIENNIQIAQRYRGRIVLNHVISFLLMVLGIVAMSIEASSTVPEKILPNMGTLAATTVFFLLGAACFVGLIVSIILRNKSNKNTSQKLGCNGALLTRDQLEKLITTMEQNKQRLKNEKIPDLERRIAALQG